MAEVSATLKAEKERRRKLERAQLLADERKRFTRELHDGMGGHLVALKSILADNPDKNALCLELVDQAILDMRLLIDSVSDDVDDVGLTMGMLRSRMEHQLKASALFVSWNMQTLPVGWSLQKGCSIHLVRILQEAITNIIRHADADWVEIRTTGFRERGNRMVRIEVADNGQGMNPEARQGRGIENMKQRCEILEGQFKLGTNPGGGTLLRIVLPCQKE